MANDSIAQARDSASLKVKRAYRHIDELQSLLERIRQTSQARLVAISDGGSQAIRITANSQDEWKDIPLIVGDCIHNVRSAYDHLWMGLHRAAATKEQAYFPFRETRKNLEYAIAKSAVTVAFPRAAKFVLEDAKTFGDSEGDRLTWAITKLDNIDKHNLILVMLKVTQITNLTVRHGSTTVTLGNVQMTATKNLMRASANAELEHSGLIAFEAVFPPDSPIPGAPVLGSLIHVARAAEKTTNRFSEIFL